MIFKPGLRSLAVAVVVSASLLMPSVASTSGQITIFGAASGSHMTLSTSGNRLEVDGAMAPQVSPACSLSQGHDHAVCNLSGIGIVELQMGDAGDHVEVLDPIPATVIAHLGGGSDKFIGSAERDSCYPEGARRNRCVGGAGDDTCITGQQNSDCVGDAGNDYCKTGAGSDGCWGGPGNDICFMGPGNDGCHGEAGNDKLYGGAGSDQLYGGAGVNFCDGLPGIGKSHECLAGPLH
jgi:Ca2+-binding RTX toxin-like protein